LKGQFHDWEGLKTPAAKLPQIVFSCRKLAT
jgi:hypothetical protein